MLQRNRDSRLPAPTSTVLQQAAQEPKITHCFQVVCNDLEVCTAFPGRFPAESVRCTSAACRSTVAYSCSTDGARVTKHAYKPQACSVGAKTYSRSKYPQRARVRTLQSLSEQVFRSNHVPVPAVRQRLVKSRSGGCLEQSEDRKSTVKVTVGTTVTLCPDVKFCQDTEI